MPKSLEDRGRVAIGSERKVGSTNVHLGFEVVEPVRRGANGLYRVMVHKDRLGYLHRPKAAEFVLVSDPDTYAITASFVLETSDQAEGEHTWQPTYLMEQVSLFLEDQTEPVSRTRIAESLHGRATYIRRAIDALVRDGYATETSGRGGARLVASANPYRDGAPGPAAAPNPSGPSDPVLDPSGTGPEHPVRPSVPLGGTGDGAADDTTEPVQAELPSDAPAWEREWHGHRAAGAAPEEPPEPAPDALAAEARVAEDGGAGAARVSRLAPSTSVRTLVALLRRDPMMSREHATRTLGHPIAWWDWKEAHVAYYELVRRRDLAWIAER